MSDVRFVYVREKNNNLTIAYEFDDEHEQIVFNTAKCCKRDTFVKATGRAIAAGRLKAKSLIHPNQSIAYTDIPGGASYGAIAAEFYTRYSRETSHEPVEIV